MTKSCTCYKVLKQKKSLTKMVLTKCSSPETQFDLSRKISTEISVEISFTVSLSFWNHRSFSNVRELSIFVNEIPKFHYKIDHGYFVFPVKSIMLLFLNLKPMRPHKNVFYFAAVVYFSPLHPAVSPRQQSSPGERMLWGNVGNFRLSN